MHSKLEFFIFFLRSYFSAKLPSEHILGIVFNLIKLFKIFIKYNKIFVFIVRKLYT